jgi:YD repeat-containing protein
VGNITSWSLPVDAGRARVYQLEYDAVDQLTAATVASGAATVERYRYAYEPAGNRTAEQIGDAVSGAGYDERNRLLNEGHLATRAQSDEG